MVDAQSKQHEHFMHLALAEARKSPPRSTNFCVGAVLVNGNTNKVLSTGYTLELPGNTHAEQCCLQKYAEMHGVPAERVGELLGPEINALLYTTMEPCVERRSGNTPCVDRITHTQSGGIGGITRVYTGVQEPDTFVTANSSRSRLETYGIACTTVNGFEEQALQIATAGHEKT